MEKSPLIEYDFRVTNLFEDLQDGVRLCRAILLLQHDSSVLTKLVVPSDTRKKNLVNCGIALQHLKHAGVPLYDEDGTVILGEDIVNGDKELTLSLLWNIFVHLQLPLLVSKVLLSEEILKIRAVGVEHSNTCTPLDMLLHWIQAICESYDCKVDNFASMVDGRAMWCLLDYYFRKDNRFSYSYKDPNGKIGEMSIMSATSYTDAVHNFLLSQKLTTLLGKFPEVIQVSDLLEHNGACNDQSVIILLVFLSFQLIVKKNMDQLNYHKFLGYNRQSPERKHCSKVGFVLSEAVENQVENGNSDMTRDFKAIMAWWREMAQRNKKCDLNPVHPTLECFSTGKLSTNTPSEKALIVCDENEVNCLQKKAASRIQLGWRSFILCNSVRRPYSAATKIQTYYRCWMLRKAFVNQKLEVIIIQNMFKCIKCWRDFQQYKIAAGLLSAVCSAIASVIGLSFEATGSCRLKAGETGTLTSLGVFDGLLLFGYHGACCLLCVPTKFCCCATSGMGSTLLSAVWNGAIAGLLRLYLQNSMSFYLLILGSNSCCCWVGSCAAGLLLQSWASCCWSGWTLYSVAECLAATVGCQIFELFMSGARAL